MDYEVELAKELADKLKAQEIAKAVTQALQEVRDGLKPLNTFEYLTDKSGKHLSAFDAYNAAITEVTEQLNRKLWKLRGNERT